MNKTVKRVDQRHRDKLGSAIRPHRLVMKGRPVSFFFEQVNTVSREVVGC